MGRYTVEPVNHGSTSASSSAILKLVAVGAILIALVGAFLWVGSQRRTLDPETLCPTSPDSVTVLLVDVTDPMNLAQRQDFLNQLERLRSSIPRYSKLAIFKVDATSASLLEPVIERCNPGTAEDVSDWTGNPKAAAEKWKEGYEEPLDHAFADLSSASGAETSPILESIQSIALTELNTQETDSKPRRFIVASDLLQNTKRLSFYGRLPEPEKVVSSDAFRSLRTDLSGIELELWMLQRPRLPAKPATCASRPLGNSHSRASWKGFSRIQREWIMAESDGLNWKDAREDRGFIDRYGFLFFAAGGSIAILVSKFFELPTWLIATGAGLAMLAYAVIVQSRGSAKLRSDQAGDNCYYLGLIFTLTSLAFAIFTFDPADTATTIVQGFGIALATTIIGLVLRVFFAQSRVDLYEVEETARLELAEAAGKLKGELNNLALEFKHFAHGMQQSVGELRDEAQDSIKAASDSAVTAVTSLSDRASKNLIEQSDRLSKTAGELATKVASVSRSMDRNRETIDRVNESHELIFEDIARVGEATKMMLSSSETVLEQCRSANAMQVGSADATERLNQSVSQLSEGLVSNIERLATLEKGILERLDDLEKGPGNVAEKAIVAIREAAQAAKADIRQLSDSHTAAVSSIGESTEALLTVVRGHNSSLETELSKSRANVGKVHNALVEMTGKLNESMKVE